LLKQASMPIEDKFDELVQAKAKSAKCDPIATKKISTDLSSDARQVETQFTMNK
jgi:hypothetical protein